MVRNFKTQTVFVSILFFVFDFGFAQTKDSNDAVTKMKTAIEAFFIANGEIDKENNLSIGAFDILDKSELGEKFKSIYLIRTVYRTDGTDYLFFKNGNDYEIVGFNDLQQLLEKTITLFENEKDEKLLQYTKSVIQWYEQTYLFRKKRNLRFTSPKTD